ncbi:unnamed protein product [Linum tenue]|uniref:Major facilitator superfamily (MFS) profile domain-containing protein n=3 Tax=Linum tenue TaxID=586396 RepID=A0AAV0NJ06_9ROSI|nr:unnamed protein product [Linum tenue]
MRAFHLSLLSFFACFVSTFAAPPLLPIIRDNLNLTAAEIGYAGIASVTGAIVARIAMGAACDTVGPRLASASLILITAPAVFFTPTVSSPVSFVLVRFLTGCSLATFVSTQYWMSSMFSSPVVGTANGVAAGWGNLGGGATQLVMPFAVTLIRRSTGAAKFTAWRIAFYVPGLFQMMTAFAVLIFGQDLPDGNFRRLENSGDEIPQILFHGVRNYRGWILALTYGYCFGVELTMDNVIAEYFYDRFNLELQTAGMIAASFGLANLISRPVGGRLSDEVAKRFGMRGRLWTLWLVQTLGGVLCVILGRVNSLGGSIVVMILFSFFCQAACGLTFGVVPFVSRRSLGLISGMTGGGGNVGAVITQLAFFRGSKYSKETGITYMGIMIICCTLPLCLINFPQWGGMFSSGRSNPSSSSSSSATEEDYYMAEWSSQEKERGLHQASLKFAENSRRERGRRSACNTAPANDTPSSSSPAIFAV